MPHIRFYISGALYDIYDTNETICMTQKDFEISAINWGKALGFGFVSLEDHVKITRSEYNELYNAKAEENKKQETADLTWCVALGRLLCSWYNQEEPKLFELSEWMIKEEGIIDNYYFFAVSQANWAKLLPLHEYTEEQVKAQIEQLKLDKPEKYLTAIVIKTDNYYTIRNSDNKVLKPLGWKDYTHYLQ